MTVRALSPAPNLPERAAENLRRAIRESRLGKASRLPSEPELALRFGLSRATIRHAISILEEEGLVSRHQGRGTFVVAPVAAIRNNLNANLGVTDFIEAAGWTPGTRGLVVSEEGAGPDTQKRLALPSRSAVVRITRVRTADGRAVAYTVDFVPIRLLFDRGIRRAELHDFVASDESLYRSLERVGVIVHHGVATVAPAIADGIIAAELWVAPGTLLLHLDQVDYMADGEPMLHSHEYHVADRLSVQVYRKGPGPRL